MKAVLTLCALGLLASCRTTATRELSSVPTPVLRVGTLARTWEVRSAGEVLGSVVLFQEHGLARDSLYVVHNRWHQDLGLIDGLGRAYRYVPHREEPAWVGSGTIAEGVQRILGLPAPCELTELPCAESGPGPGPAEAEAPPALAAEPPTPAPGSAARPAGAPSPDSGLPQSR